MALTIRTTPDEDLELWELKDYFCINTASGVISHLIHVSKNVHIQVGLLHDKINILEKQLSEKDDSIQSFLSALDHLSDC